MRPIVIRLQAPARSSFGLNCPLAVLLTPRMDCPAHYSIPSFSSAPRTVGFKEWCLGTPG